MKKSSKKLIVILTSIILMFSLAPAISFAATTTSLEKTDNDNIKITSKAKTVKYKLNWNANGGKIGSKKTIFTSVKKGSKIGKLVTTPKRNNYLFKGWYTKKSGGTKITKNTVPKKSVVYYAQYIKKSNIGTTTNSKLLGTWRDYNNIFVFNKNGKFAYFYSSYTSYGLVMSKTEGKYKATNGKIYFTNIVYEAGGTLEKHHKNTVFEYKFGKDKDGEYLLIPNIFSDNKPYLEISSATKLRKS